MKVGKLRPLGKINFPGFQRILDFTSDGSEPSVSVAVDGDTDKEYIQFVYNPHASSAINTTLNNVATNTYGQQYLINAGGSISAGQSVIPYLVFNNKLGITIAKILTPAGLVKTSNTHTCEYTSGTTINTMLLLGNVYNSTDNITSIDFALSLGGNFTAGTRIIVFARRSNV